MFKKRRNGSRAKSTEKLASSEYGGDEDEMDTLKNGFNLGLSQQHINLCDSYSTNLTSPALSPYSSTRSSTLSGSRCVVNLLTKTVHKLASSFMRSGRSIGGSIDSGIGSGFAGAIFETRDRDKKELQRLNDRLADFVEKVRFMEIQNKALSRDVDCLKSYGYRVVDDTDKTYDVEIVEAFNVVELAKAEISKLKNEFDKLRQSMSEQRKRFEEIRNKRDLDSDTIESLMQQLCDAECDISFLRKRIEWYEKNIDRVKTENSWLQDELQRLQRDVNEETLNAIDLKSQHQTIIEEVEFLRRIQSEILEDLRQALWREFSPSIIDDSRQSFKTELTSAIREIRRDYESAYAKCRSEMETRYKLKVNEIQIASSPQNRPEKKILEEEIKKTRVQMFDVRSRYVDVQSKNALLESQTKSLTDQIEDDRLQHDIAMADYDQQSKLIDEERRNLLAELTNLLDKNNTMDAELALYRKLLDSENC